MRSHKAIKERREELGDLQHLIKQQVDNKELTLSEHQRMYNNIKAEELALETREQQLRSQHDVQRAKAASTRPGASERSKSARASHRGPGSLG